MNDNESYMTPEEAASLLKLSKYTVYEMVKRGQLPATRVGRKILLLREDIEQFLDSRKTQTLHKTADPSPLPPEDALYFAGSHDLSIDLLVDALKKQGVRLYPVFCGSIEGLMELFKERVDLAGCHLLDPEQGTYNLPYVSRFLPHEPVTVLHFVERWQGFMVPKGNPRGIREWSDFLSGKFRIANRQKGAGTRILLDQMLHQMNIPASAIPGYQREEPNHYATAAAVLRGDADAALGIASVARKMGLDFVPMEKEQYDFVIPSGRLEDHRIRCLRETLLDPQFQQAIEALGGYEAAKTGQIHAQFNG